MRSPLLLVFVAGLVGCHGKPVEPDAPDCGTPCLGPECHSPVTVSAGLDHTCAVGSDAHAYCWGDNSAGQLGDGTTVLHIVPVQVLGLDDVVEVGAGFWFSCARISSGEVWCWGLDNAGQLGDGLPYGDIDRFFPTPKRVEGLDDVVRLSVGAGHACALRADGTVWCWGHGPETGGIAGRSTPPTRIGDRFCAREIMVGGDISCAIRADQTLWCWGSNSRGELGDGTTIDHPRPVQVTAVDDAIALASAVMTCALTAAGRVTCWGLVDPTLLRPPSVDAVDITVGLSHACVRTSAARTLCWGRNDLGQLGNGAATGVPSDPVGPVEVAGLNATEIHAGWEHTCARTDRHAVTCWGLNENGQLGDGTFIDRAMPADVVGLP